MDHQHYFYQIRLFTILTSPHFHDMNCKVSKIDRPAQPQFQIEEFLRASSGNRLGDDMWFQISRDSENCKMFPFPPIWTAQLIVLQMDYHLSSVLWGPLRNCVIPLTNFQGDFMESDVFDSHYEFADMAINYKTDSHQLHREDLRCSYCAILLLEDHFTYNCRLNLIFRRLRDINGFGDGLASNGHCIPQVV